MPSSGDQASATEWTAALARAAAFRAAAEWPAADEAYESVFSLAVAARDVVGVVKALMGRTILWFHWKSTQEAAELADLTCEVSSLCGLHGTHARALNLLGALHVREEEWGAAREYLERALDRAYVVRDIELVGAISTNLGAICNIQGDYAEARSRYLESIGSCVRTEARSQLVMAYNNLGMLCSDSAEWMEALVYFGRAVEIAEEGDDPGLLALVRVNEVEPLIQTGELPAALSALAAAKPVAERLGNIPVQADVARFYARIARIQGDLRTADRHLRESLDLARSAGLDLHTAEALEELAMLSLAGDAPEPAQRAFAEARELYERVGAARDLERVVARLRELPARGISA